MSGFDKEWLRLREPADREARSSSLVEAVKEYIQSHSRHVVMDIGCGTGSTFRTLSPRLPDVKWKLLDYETRLLDEAKRQIGPRDHVSFHCADLNTLDESLLNNVAVVTASALFDLCSADFCRRFVERLARKKIGLYAALNYDGAMEWSIKHPLDRAVVASFNQHQRTDKGFGPALGPDASGYLSSLCEDAGFSVKTASSPWALGPDSEALQSEFLAGLAAPIQEIGNIDTAEFKSWLEFRFSRVGVDGSRCIVGHTDFLALPNV
ncbi:SAM-dependent methyltransferase [Agrobacterium larrymoorei]|uniref:SAM-dependent methyltransferase n=1 Tax=Agrobacterium larrymoorei TaxID=160699 RepID=A0AAJ2B8M5_9HYPH|nr:class I SAM-dependent methyltransferase [Agrobacterium larrymoorei]MDR6101506.1 SAM-dependent methyltransferase [Agrobacterium larrymoorei]